MSLTSEIDALSSQLTALVKKVEGKEDARKQLFGVAMGAASQLESSLDLCWRLIMSPHAPAALMTLLKMGVFDHLASAAEPISAQSLAKATEADSLLIVRLLRPLVALGVVAERDEELYASTDTVKLLTDPVLKGGYIFMFTSATHSLSQMPFYLESTSYQNVTGNPGPFQAAKSTTDDMFPWIIKNDLMHHFNYFMSGQQANRGDWFNRLDVEDMILNGASKDNKDTLFVDIGGGKGHDIAAFARRFSYVPGKLVLQDLPPVIESIQDLDSRITRMSYDFFTPQPIRGARVYYLRSIMHDWSDAKCGEILSRVREAMTPGYSKLLLNEFVIPAKKAPLYPSLLDINMMCLLNGMERTEKQWSVLLSDAGFNILKFHTDPTGENEGIIEAVLK